jgi:hypothetical protein
VLGQAVALIVGNALLDQDKVQPEDAFLADRSKP